MGVDIFDFVGWEGDDIMSACCVWTHEDFFDFESCDIEFSFEGFLEFF